MADHRKTGRVETKSQNSNQGLKLLNACLPCGPVVKNNSPTQYMRT